MKRSPRLSLLPILFKSILARTTPKPETVTPDGTHDWHSNGGPPYVTPTTIVGSNTKEGFVDASGTGAGLNYFTQRVRQVHYFSGLLLATFVAVHLTNHLLAGLSPATHIAFMTATRLVYRNPVVETALLAAVTLQISTGIRLVRSVARQNSHAWSRLHIGSGLYLAFF
ncbi:hypothetical protein [Spirosoma pollinicola]|uniref:hypothetical protein n=1 Tax=Spirosoma pollinicola TaxID=2057025 RepID=UPI001F0BB853|nr:hypothetical protein [Spirosoma pollinicola]